MNEYFYNLNGESISYEKLNDEHEIVRISDKEAKIGNIGKIVKGENNSQLLTFEINRFYDNVDLKDMNILFLYQNKDGIFTTKASNIIYNNYLLRFNWLLPYGVTLYSGTITACIHFIGKDENVNYTLKTTNFHLTVEDSLDGTDIEITVPVNWFADIESRLSGLEQKECPVTNDLTDELKAAYDDAVLKKHEHSNKSIIDKFSENSDGKILYNGKEIGHDIIIDPVDYVNGSQGIEDTPVGHIISHMGTTAPKHYLICDGSTYNILDYPYLANHIKTDFGSYNYFGGNGIDTFAVPDLRNNFIRGYHGDAAAISGDIGQYQSGTYIANTQINDPIGLNPISIVCAYGTSSNSEDETFQTNKIGVAQIQGKIENEEYRGYYYTSRPRNAAVLFCIKYEPTYFMNLIGVEVRDVLWEGKVNGATTLTLTNNYDEYDKIVFVGVALSNSSVGKVNKTFYTSDIGFNINDIFLSFYDDRYIAGHFTSAKNTFIIDRVIGTALPSLTKIYGIRHNTKPINKLEVIL